MIQLRRSLLAGLGAAAVAAFALVGNLATSASPIPAGAVKAVWVLAALLAVVCILLEVQRSRAENRPSGMTDIDLAITADRLAGAVRQQWEREEQQRKIHDPVALPVRWHAAAEQLVDHWPNILRVPAGVPADPVAVAGDITEITHMYERVPSGRLVVLGAAGAGKTVLASRLALDLLKTRAAGGPVPVIVSVASWNPATTDLAGLLDGQLRRDNRWLSPAQKGAADKAGALLDAGLILPILDGFDEIPHPYQRSALQRLNAVPDWPLIVTSRVDEYTAAVGDTDVLTAAAGVELDPLTTEDLSAYLPRTTTRRVSYGGSSVNVWEPILNHLREHPDHPASVVLSEALTSPLMVYLARVVYSDTPDHDPLELLDFLQFPTVAAVEEHLIAAYIPAVYSHPSQTGPSWTAREANRWLTFLAAHLDRKATPDLAWWELRDSIPKGLRTVAFGVTIGLLSGLFAGSAVGVGAILTPYPPPPRQRPGTFLSIQYDGIAALHGRDVAIQMTLTAIMVALFYGPVGAIMMRYAPAPQPARTYFSTRLRRLVPVFCVVLLAVWGVMHSDRSMLPLGLLLVPFYLLLTSWSRPIDTAAVVSPADLMATDRRVTIWRFVAAACGGGYVGLVAGVPLGLAAGLAAGLWTAAVFGSVGLFTTASGQWLILLEFWLPLTRRLPWHGYTFLTDAHRRGVLRQVGAVYQFRHARLQHHLLSALGNG